MKAKSKKIFEKAIAVSTCAVLVVFALMFATLAVCAGFDAIVERDLFSAIACVASAAIALFWIDFLRG